MELTQKILKELIYYDPKTGLFIWLLRDIKWFTHCKYPQMTCDHWNLMYENKIAGCIRDTKDEFSSKYIGIKVLGIPYRAHTLAWLYIYGYMPLIIDHIDHNGLNNAILNLRDSTHMENQQNRPMQKNNTSGFTGVSWKSKLKKWQVQINFNKKRVYGGVFSNLNDAIKRRQELNIEYGFHKNHGKKYV